MLLPNRITLTHSEPKKHIFRFIYSKKNSNWIWVVGLIIGQDDSRRISPKIRIRADRYHIFGADARIRKGGL